MRNKATTGLKKTKGRKTWVSSAKSNYIEMSHLT